jgi:N6-adenosine-specific RNA methylase IME4
VKIDIFNTDKKYNIIYADPPWSYRDYTSKEVAEKNLNSNSKKSVVMKYEVMKTANICDLPIENIASEDCILFMWVTMPKLNEVFEVIKSWGFKYSTVGFTWVKKNKKNKNSNFWGMGRWTRSNAELCLIGIKGHPKRVSASVHSVIESCIEEHSKKPDIVREKIVELCGDLPRVELFARQYADGWDCWGNEAPESNEQKVC